VVFAGAEAFQASVVAAATAVPAERTPIDAFMTGLAEASNLLLPYRDYVRQRRDLIASSTDLRERELIKMASLTTALTEAGLTRGTDRWQATLSAQAAVAAFMTAYDRWADEDGIPDFPALLHKTLYDLRNAIGN
jgi:hypothetical protein